MFSLTSVERVTQGQTDPPAIGEKAGRIIMPTPKSEPNLRSSFVFNETGSKDIGGRDTTKKGGSIPTVE